MAAKKVAPAVIIDTNVPLVANGSCEGVNPNCRLEALDFLEQVLHSGRLVVDLEGEVEAEYRNKLSMEKPGIGNRFIQLFFSQAAHRVERISLQRAANGDYTAFQFSGSLKRFDKSDRKFVALAAATGHTIHNATDSDWLEHHDDLKNRGIKITFLCSKNKGSWFVARR